MVMPTLARDFAGEPQVGCRSLGLTPNGGDASLWAYILPYWPTILAFATSDTRFDPSQPTGSVGVVSQQRSKDIDAGREQNPFDSSRKDRGD
jgi:hypothetical protein